MEDTTHHQRTYRHDSYIMFLVMVDVELNGPSGRMLEAHLTRTCRDSNVQCTKNTKKPGIKNYQNPIDSKEIG